MRMAILCAGTLLLAAGMSGVGQEKVEPGFTPLFNGKTLDGWHIMNKAQFSVKDKVIFLNRGRGWLRSDKQYKDFELRMEFRFVSKGADGGIFIRAGEKGGNWPSKNYQVQTMDNNSIAGIFSSGQPRPKLKKDNAKLKSARKPTGEWQSYVITAKGPKAEIKLNGELVTVAEGLAEEAGYIGIQGEGGQIEFKNIRIKVLK